MDLSDLTSQAGYPALKPEMAIVAGSIETDSMLVNTLVVNGRVTQEAKAGGHLTPYTIWRAPNDVDIIGPGLQVAMNNFVGPIAIPAASCYAGMTAKIKVQGLLTVGPVPGTDALVLSIRDLANSVLYSSAAITSAATTDRLITAEFIIQLAALGGPGAARLRSTSTLMADAVPAVVLTASLANNITFSTLAGVEYALWVQHSTASTFTRQIAYAVIEA